MREEILVDGRLMWLVLENDSQGDCENAKAVLSLPFQFCLLIYEIHLESSRSIKTL